MINTLRDIVMIALAATVLAAASARAEEEPRLDPIALSEIEQALAYHRAVSDKIIERAVADYPPEALRARETGRVILALDIDPELAEAYAVRGLMEMMEWEFDRLGTGNVDAATSFQTALAMKPNLADAYVWFASLRQSEGDIDAAIERSKQIVAEEGKAR